MIDERTVKKIEKWCQKYGVHTNHPTDDPEIFDHIKLVILEGSEEWKTLGEIERAWKHGSKWAYMTHILKEKAHGSETDTRNPGPRGGTREDRPRFVRPDPTTRPRR